jgi:7-cyano-7-deazaguanine reductase
MAGWLAKWFGQGRGMNRGCAAVTLNGRCPHKGDCRCPSSSLLARIPHSGQQRGMESTPDKPAPTPSGAPQFLGKDTPLPTSPETAVLDYVPNPRPGLTYLVRFVSPEFTSLCPVTNQPDFAHLVIDYVPGDTIVESKSLKLFLGSFRNHNGFHEDVTVGIGVRLFEEMRPQWLRIGGYWYPRGGIPIDVFWQSSVPPEGLWLPDQGVPSYRGRG